MMLHPANRPNCNCTDRSTCHDPASHEVPIWCCDCGDVEVSEEGRCAECETAYVEWATDDGCGHVDTLDESRGER